MPFLFGILAGVIMQSVLHANNPSKSHAMASIIFGAVCFLVAIALL